MSETDRKPMNIQSHEGDPVQEAINRAEYHTTRAYGVVDDVEVLAVARVDDSSTPVLTVYAGGEYDEDADEYAGGKVVNEVFTRLWELNERFGEVNRDHGLEVLDNGSGTEGSTQGGDDAER